jgi:hypothetical protein
MFSQLSHKLYATSLYIEKYYISLYKAAWDSGINRIKGFMSYGITGLGQQKVDLSRVF